MMSLRGSRQMQHIEDVVTTSLSFILQIKRSELDHSHGFVALGGSSQEALLLSTACKERRVSLSMASILLSQNLRDLFCKAKDDEFLSVSPNTSFPTTITKLHSPPSSSLCFPASTLDAQQSCHLDSIDPVQVHRLQSRKAACSCTGPTTEIQQTFILASQRNFNANIVTFKESYFTRDIPALKLAWDRVLEQEPIFHSTFLLASVDQYSMVHKEYFFHWSESFVDTEDEYLSELTGLPSNEFLSWSFRVIHFRKSEAENQSTIIWHVHHSLIDGVSAALIYQKVHVMLNGGNPHPGTPFSSVARGLQRLQCSTKAANDAFWMQKSREFTSATGRLPLRTVHPTPSSVCCNRTVDVPAPDHCILSFARYLQVTPVAIHQAAWALVLSMYTDSDTVVYGSILSGRTMDLTGAEDTIGPLINTLPFFVRINVQQQSCAFIQEIFRDHILLDSVSSSVAGSTFTRDFDSALAMEVEMQRPQQSKIKPIGSYMFDTTTDIPLTILVRKNGGATLSFDNRKYSEKDIALLSQYYQNALTTLMKPGLTLQTSLTSIQPRTCLTQLRELGNCASKASFITSACEDLVTLFLHTVSANPSRAAIEKESTEITYVELDNLSSRVADYLQSFLSPGDAVCVLADRSVNWIIAIYAVLKASGIYVPLSPDAPVNIAKQYFQTANCQIFLAPHSTALTHGQELSPRSLAVDQILQRQDKNLATSCFRYSEPRPNYPAYVCFTSGSTGNPKGVVCTHAGVVAFQKDVQVRLFSAPGRRISQVMAPAFDGSVHEIFSALSYGSTLVLPGLTDTFAHIKTVHSAVITPSLANVLDPKDFPGLTHVYFVGEPVSQHTNDVWASQKILYNMYGPSETTCGATIKRLLPSTLVTIGKPVSSTRIYILDRNQDFLPPGIPGDLFIGGIQVSQGYLGANIQANERFQKDHICGQANERMYFTGDRGFWTSSGDICLIGRNDRQIKLNGFRIDLNAMEETILGAIAQASGAAVLRNGDHLVLALQPDIDCGLIRTALKEILPSYAIPRIIFSEMTLPLSAIGKLDYKALLQKASALTSLLTENESELLPNWSPTERMVADVWLTLLDSRLRSSLVPSSNFARLGGHSLLQISLASKLSETFQCLVSVSTVIHSPTVAAQAETIEAIKASTIIKPLPPQTSSSGHRQEVSPLENYWWQKYQSQLGSSAFNVATAYAFDRKKVDRRRLRNAWNQILKRHKLLNSRFVWKHGALRREYHEHPPRARWSRRMSLHEEVNHQFDLKKEHGIRIMLTARRMLICASHIICDLTTLRTLLQEVFKAYHDQTLYLRALREPAETSRGNEIALDAQTRFWRERLEQLQPLRFNHRELPNRSSYGGTSRLCRFDASLAQQIYRFNHQRGFTLHQIALSAITLALSSNPLLADIVFGSPYINRGPHELEAIGLFVEPLPIRVKFEVRKGTESTTELLETVQQSSQEALSHTIPWTQLLSHLNQGLQPPHNPLFDVMVSFHDNRDSSMFPLDGFQELLTWSEGSKFKLMFEFTALSEEILLLRFEYDTQCFSLQDILELEMRTKEAFRCILEDCLFSEATHRISSLHIESCSEDVSSSSFGVKIDCL